jgi:ClpP class serine protease
MTITGSIGVILHTWNYRALMDKIGLQPVVYKSGRYKDMLSGEREPDQITPEERQMVKSIIDETFGRFKSVVGQGRKFARDHGGRALSEDWTRYADGRVLSGTEAYNLGFVDQLGTFEDAVERAMTFARSLQPHMRSSLAHDLNQGNRLEVESLAGAVVRYGREAGVPTPLNFAIYACLKPYHEEAEAARQR